MPCHTRRRRDTLVCSFTFSCAHAMPYSSSLVCFTLCCTRRRRDTSVRSFIFCYTFFPVSCASHCAVLVVDETHCVLFYCLVRPCCAVLVVDETHSYVLFCYTFLTVSSASQCAVLVVDETLGVLFHCLVRPCHA